MTFLDLPAGTDVFIDANIFVYAHSAHPQFGGPCGDLLERIDRREVSGYTSAHVLTESAHRLMTLDACTTFGWPYAGIGRRLRRHSSQIQLLTRFGQAIEQILQSAVQVLPVTGSLASAGAAASCQYGLLSNDALLIAIMQQRALTNLASTDGDFDHIAWLTRYAPV